MKLKVNLGGEKIKPPTPETAQEGWLSYLNRNILTPVAKGIATRAVGSLPEKEYGLEAIREFNPAFAAELEKPENRLVRLASTEKPDALLGTIAEVAPGFVQAGGLKSLQKAGQVAKTALGSLVGGEVGAGAASALGFGETGQKALGLVGSIGGGTYAGRVGAKRPSEALAEKAFSRQKIERPKKIEQLESQQKHLYDQVGKGYKNLSLPAKGLEEAIQRIEDDLQVGVSRKDRASIQETTSQLRDLVKYGKVNVQKAIKFVQNRNKAVYDQTISPTVKQYNQQMISDVNEFINEAGRQNPLLGKAYQDAKQITTDLHELRDVNKKYEKMSFKDYKKDLAKKTFEEYLDEGLKLAKGQILPSVLSLVTGFFGGKTAAKIGYGAVTAGQFIKREVSNINTILKDNPGLSEELNKLAEAAFNEDKPLFTSIITRINDRFVKKEEKEKPKIKGKVRFR